MISITIKNISISSYILAELIPNICTIKIIVLHDDLNQEKFKKIYSRRINDMSNLYLSQKCLLPASASVEINQLSINMDAQMEALQRAMTVIIHKWERSMS